MEEWITRKSPEYRELQEKALAALDRIEAMIETLPSHLNAETYLTSEEVRNLFGLSQRSLQTYRDERIIPYTTLGGKFLYPMSEIAKILEKNLVKPIQRYDKEQRATRCSCFFSPSPPAVGSLLRRENRGGISRRYKGRARRLIRRVAAATPAPKATDSPTPIRKYGNIRKGASRRLRVRLR